jgi:hypothetical protein
MLKKPSLNLGVLLLVLIFLDIATTFYGIHYLGSYEANFLISWLPLELVSIFKILVGIYLIELIQRGRRYFGKKIELILLPPIIVYSIVVSNNIVQILERIR